MDQELQAWHKRIETAKTKRAASEYEWKLQRDAIVGPRYRSDMGDRQHGHPLNLRKSYLDVTIPQLVYADPEFTVTAKRGGDDRQAAAELMTQVLTAWAQEVKLGLVGRRGVRNSLYSAGILMVTYSPKTNLVAEVDSSQGGGGRVGIDVDKARQPEQPYHDQALPGVRCISPVQFIHDPGATGLEEAYWAGHAQYPSVELFKADPVLRKWADQVKPTHKHRPRPYEDSGEWEDPLMSYVEIYEVYDVHRQQVLWIPGPSAGIDQILHKMPMDHGYKGLPYSMFSYAEVDGEFWPQSPLSGWADLADGADDTLAAVTEGAQQAKRLVLYDLNQVDKVIAQQIRDAPNGAVLGVPGLSQHVQNVEMGGIHADQLRLLELQRATVDDVSGVGQLQRGQREPGQPTATEIERRNQASGTRIGDMQREVRRVLAEVAMRAMAIMITHREELAGVELALRRHGNEVAHVVLDAGKLVGTALEYDYDVEPGSIVHVDPTIKQQRGQQLLALASDPGRAQWLQMEGYKWNYATLVHDVVRDMGVTTPKRYLDRIPQDGQPPVDQAEADLAAQETLQMLGGEWVEVNETDQDASHLRVHLEAYQMSQSELLAQHAQMHMQRLQQAAPAAPPPAAGAAAPAAPAGV